MKLNWNDITSEHVIEAIRMFEDSAQEYPPTKNTFLEYNGKTYPAKHIRLLTYRAAFGIDAPKAAFSSGTGTVHFFEQLGFSVRYGSRCTFTPVQVVVKQRKKHGESSVPDPTPAGIMRNIAAINSKKTRAARIPAQNVIEQKDALQLVLTHYFNGDIVSEKTFGWLAMPADSGEYPYLINALQAYRGKTGFDKSTYKLRCDFVCESRKLIFEYDERQHFTLARKAVLESYPDDIPLYFDKQAWISACKHIHAKDNDPHNQDEIRAYYDSIRDLQSAQNGYRLIRIMHGAYDWKAADAVRYIDALIGMKPSVSLKKAPHASSLKLGLYVQGREDYNELAFRTRLNDVSEKKIDLFVFPEACYTPFAAEFYGLKLSEPNEVALAVERAMQISRGAGCAIIIGAEDKTGFIYSLYANAFAFGDETPCRLYIKHTMTLNSPLRSADYKEALPDIFKPVILKGFKIGMTICYDCDHAAFSRAWGKQGVDLIINSTHGNVVYYKWYRYHKVRALENNCFTFCTMGYEDNPKINSYPYGFTPNGALMAGDPIYPIHFDRDKINNICIYDTAEFDGRYEPEIRLNQPATPNTKRGQWQIDPTVKGITNLLAQAKKIDDGLYRYCVGTNNVILCCVDGPEICKPENVLRLLYHPLLKEISNKRYLIISRWMLHDSNLYDTVLSDILKVRAMENFCAVLYTAPGENICIQPGKTKNVQSVMLTEGKYKLDFGRMAGPEAIWKNKEGMRQAWRTGYEALISTLQ